MYLPLFVSSLYATFEELTTHFASEPEEHRQLTTRVEQVEYVE